MKRFSQYLNETSLDNTVELSKQKLIASLESIDWLYVSILEKNSQIAATYAKNLNSTIDIIEQTYGWNLTGIRRYLS